MLSSSTSLQTLWLQSSFFFSIVLQCSENNDNLIHDVTDLKHVSSLWGCIDQLSWSIWWKEARWCFLDQREGSPWNDIKKNASGREMCHQGWTDRKISYSHWSGSWKTAEQTQTIIQSCPLTAHVWSRIHQNTSCPFSLTSRPVFDTNKMEHFPSEPFGPRPWDLIRAAPRAESIFDYTWTIWMWQTWSQRSCFSLLQEYAIQLWDDLGSLD